MLLLYLFLISFQVQAIQCVLVSFKWKGPTIPEIPQLRSLWEKRDGVQTLLFQPSATYNYVINVTIPSMNLTLPLVLDTGSSDTWIDASVFRTSLSSTYHSNSTTAELSFSAGTVAGNWGYDNFEIGGVTVNNLSFVSVTDSSLDVYGVIGIAYPDLETTYASYGYVYENLPQLMKSQGLISQQLYSIITVPDSYSGSVLFGEIDKSQFEGELHYLDNQDIGESYPTYTAVKFEGLTIGNLSIDASSSVVVLDSGSIPILVPSTVYEAINKAFGDVLYNDEDQMYYFTCIEAGAEGDKKVIFNFGDFQIASTISKLQIQVDEGTNTCWTGIEDTQSTQEYYLFGDSFLQNVYFVVDQESQRVGLAQLTTTDVVGSISGWSSTTETTASSSSFVQTETSSTRATVTTKGAYSSSANPSSAAILSNSPTETLSKSSSALGISSETQAFSTKMQHTSRNDFESAEPHSGTTYSTGTSQSDLKSPDLDTVSSHSQRSHGASQSKLLVSPHMSRDFSTHSQNGDARGSQGAVRSTLDTGSRAGQVTGASRRSHGSTTGAAVPLNSNTSAVSIFRTTTKTSSSAQERPSLTSEHADTRHGPSTSASAQSSQPSGALSRCQESASVSGHDASRTSAATSRTRRAPSESPLTDASPTANVVVPLRGAASTAHKAQSVTLALAALAACLAA